MAAITIVIKGTKCIATTKGACMGWEQEFRAKQVTPTHAGLIKAGGLKLNL